MKKITLWGGMLLLALPALASPPKVQAPMPSGTVEFVANRQQLNSAVLFSAQIAGGNLYLEQGRLVQALRDMKQADAWHDQPEKLKNYRIPAHAYATTFVGANKQATVEGEKQLPGYTNYFLGNDPKHWASKVPSFEGVRYQALYPGIDLHFYGKETTLEYDFEVGAGADPSLIAMRYDGQTKLSVVNGALNIGTSVGTVVEQRPFAYQLVDGQRQRVACDYVLGKQNTVTFRLAQGYNHALPLVIDPVLVYATYTGSQAVNYGFTATYDSLGNLYSGGDIHDAASYPATLGAYDISYNGSLDMGLIKYNPRAATGAQSRVWATYVGGSGADRPHSLLVDRLGNLIVMGSTSSTNYPVIAGTYDNSFNGGSFDIVLTKFTDDGAILRGSTYLGGSDSDGYLSGTLQVNYGDWYRGDLAVDQAGNIYVASVTASSNFPTTTGVAQPNYGTGPNDGIVTKLNSSLSAVVWSTYIGGSGDDAAYSLQIDASNNVFISGGTTSANLPATTGSYKPALAGGTDGFIARLTSAGAMVRTTYIGTTAYDQAHFVQLDNSGNVYTYGQTAGAYPVSAGVYNNPGSRLFIHKLDGQLTTSIFSTVVGNGASGSPSLSPTAFSVTDCGNILLSGWTSQAGYPVTPDAIQATGGSGTTSGGFGPFWIAQLSNNAANLVYGTYYGASSCHVDGGTSRFDKQGNVYQSICVGTGTITTTSNAWSATNRASWNNASFKMDVSPLSVVFTPSVVQAGPRAQQGCAPQTFFFARASTTGVATWDFGNGQTPVTGVNSTSSVYTTPGVYTVKLTVVDSSQGCTQTAVSTETVTVYGIQATNAGPDRAICQGSSVTLSVPNQGTGVTYTWSPAAGLNTTTGTTVTASPTATTTYTVVASNTNCSTSATVRVTVNPLPSTAVGPDKTICIGSSTTLTVPDAGTGATYLWSPATGLSSTTSNTVTANPTVTTQYTVQVTAATGCVSTGTVTVNVAPLPSANAGSTQAICLGGSATLTVPDAGTGATYLWSPAVGLSSTTSRTVTASPTATTLYTVRVTTAAGCTSTGTVTVTVNPLPSANAGPDQNICPGGSTTLTVPDAGTGATYLWSPAAGLNSTTSRTVTASPIITTLYTVRVTTAAGCSSTATVTVNVAPAPRVAIQASATNVLLNTAINFTSTTQNPVTSYLWNFGDGTGTSTTAAPTYTYTRPGTYQARLTVTYGPALCTESVQLPITIRPFELPNVITPNNDGLNDTFRPDVSNSPVNIEIYDRWGRKVYEQQSYTGRWGNEEGTAPGVYYYRLSTTAGESWKGWLEVIK